MGTRLSTALIPVCIGSRTEIRGMMPGAFTPTRSRRSVLIGPWMRQMLNLGYLQYMLHGDISNENQSMRLVKNKQCNTHQ